MKKKNTKHAPAAAAEPAAVATAPEQPQTEQSADVAEQDAASAPAEASKNATQTKNAPKARPAKKAAEKAKAKAAEKLDEDLMRASIRKAEAKLKATQAKAAAKKAPKAKAKKEAVPREFSKKAIILDLMRRKGGATLAEIMAATGWQAHSVRGFVSGTLMKKMDLPVESFKNATDERTYRIAK